MTAVLIKIRHLEKMDTHTHTHTREVDYVKMKAEIKMIFPQDKVSQTASKALEAGGGA